MISSGSERPLAGLDICLYEQMEEAIGIYSREARVLYLNPAAERMIGRPRKEALGQIFWELFPKSVDTPFQRAFHQVALTGQSQQFDAGYDDADGSHWFSHRIYASGNVIYAIAVDMTDKRKAHETLKLNACILESMAEGVGLVDDEGVFLYTNPAWERMLGYERGELTGTRLSQELLEHLREQGRWAGELQYVRTDGALLTTYARMTAMELRGRSHYICVQEDITERKRDEARRQQLAREVEAARAETESERRRLYQLFNEAPAGIALLRGPQHIYALSNPINTELIHDEQVLARQRLEVLAEQLHHGEERLRTLVEASSVILWSTDAGGMSVEDSASWRAYTGQTLEQWLSPWGWLEAVHPEDRDRAFRAWSDAFTHGFEYNIEFRLHRVGGDYRHVQSRAVLLRQPDGAPREWFGAITDIHQRKQGELQLRQSIQMRDEFLSVASHELRTPLTPLNLLLQGLLRAASTQPDTPFTQLVTRGAEAGRRQIQRLVRLVGDLLDVSRISEGRLQPRREEMDLVALVQEVVSRFELQATTAGCQLELHAPGPVVGWWDGLRLEQVVVNLVDNALKYGPGRPVCVRVDRLEDKAVLHVTDEGMGIPPEHQSRIFERFERAVSERHYGGLGLGLFISQQIVRAHGGLIRVESTPGVRTTFTVELPLEP